MSHAVVGLLDADLTASVEAVWESLAARFGLHDLRARVPWPHISFHVAGHYDWDQIEGGLGRLTTAYEATTVTSEAFTLFTGPGAPFPVLTRIVVRSPDLAELFDAIQTLAAPHAEHASPYTTASTWLPHITLASRDVTPVHVGEVMAAIAADPPPAWLGTIDRIALVEDIEGEHRLRAVHSLA